MSQGYAEDYKTKKSPVKKVGTIFFTLQVVLYNICILNINIQSFKNYINNSIR